MVQVRGPITHVYWSGMEQKMVAAELGTTETPDIGDSYDAVILGAGIGGLACGALLAKEGLEVLVVERHDRPGGFVTDYERGGYLFQVPLVMSGCGRNCGVTRVAERLGLNVEFKRVDPCMRFIYPEHDISLWSDVEEFKESLKDGFQPQTENINRFFRMARSAWKGMDTAMLRRPLGPGAALARLAYPLTHPATCRAARRRATWERSLESFLTDDRLKSVMSAPCALLGAPPWEISSYSMLWMLKGFTHGAWVPVGGYGALAEAFARSLIDSGGKLLLKHEAASVDTEAGRVSEVELNPRTKVRTPVVVSDVDSARTFLRILGREGFSRAFIERVEERRVSLSGFAIHIGMARRIEEPEFSGGPVLVHPSYDHREMLDHVSGREEFPEPGRLPWVMMSHSIHDGSLAPSGSSTLNIMVPGVPYAFKNRWGAGEGGARGDEYRGIKERYAEVLVEAVASRFPGLIGDVEAYDISTPVTYERYTMATDGCWFDAAPVAGELPGGRPGPDTQLKGLYVTGAKSVLGAGIHASVVSGLLAADSVLGGALSPLFD